VGVLGAANDNDYVFVLGQDLLDGVDVTYMDWLKPPNEQ
jgi:hypothetical protein